MSRPAKAGKLPGSTPAPRGDTLTLDRRRFLTAATCTASLVALGGLGRVHASSSAAHRVLSPVRDRTTGLSLLRLPPGFEYCSFGWTGDPLGDGRPTPPMHDGMAVVRARGTTLTLIRNHEITADHGAFGGPDTAYDPAAAGGTTTLDFDAEAGRLRAARASLSGTLTNCAGGPTPWGTWLSCEETLADAGGDYDGRPLTRLREDHGFVFEVPADGVAAGRPLTAMGRFVHEAAAVDPASGTVYLTEDMDPAGFYRFLPDQPGRLEAGGRLQMMRVLGRAQMAVGMPAAKLDVGWVDIEKPERGHDCGRDRNGVVNQGLAAGATRFVRLEGCWFDQGRVYFASTSGGHAGCGVIFVHDPTEQTLTKLYESPHRRELDSPDNLTVAPNGAVVLCEDGSRYGQLMMGLTGAGELLPIAQNDVQLRGERNGLAGDFRGAEWCGACFSPDGRWLFANIQQPGITFAITGPWRDLLSHKENLDA